MEAFLISLNIKVCIYITFFKIRRIIDFDQRFRYDTLRIENKNLKNNLFSAKTHLSNRHEKRRLFREKFELGFLNNQYSSLLPNDLSVDRLQEREIVLLGDWVINFR